MIYRINIPTKIFTIIFLVLMCWLGSFVFFDEEAILYQKSAGFLLMLSPFLSYFLVSEKTLVDDDKIVIYRLLFKKILKKQGGIKTSLIWGEIVEFRSSYVLYPESPLITLLPRGEPKKRKIELLIGGMGGMDLDLLKDILSHLSPGTKVYLYPHLEKMLQRKPESKRKIIFIAAILTLAIAAAFFLEWFKIRNVAPILGLILLVGLFFATTLWHKN
ncbi:MAG: hypothetical protein Q8N85_06340 [Candidatus Omnitrophota bacterium]|nr:hypothetical protein [Candidatus Omnitrophota bacterium]